MFMPIQFGLTRIRNRALGLIVLALLAGCSKPPDFQCPESMDAEDYTLDSLKKLTQIQLLETRLEEVNRQCEIPTQKSFDFAELLLKVAREGTPEQAMWLYGRIQSRPAEFRKNFLAASENFGLTKPASPSAKNSLTLVSPENIGAELTSASITPEQAALAKTKFIEYKFSEGQDEFRRIVHVGDNPLPILMQSIDVGSNATLISVRFDSLANAEEISLRLSSGEKSEWEPASENRAAGNFHKGMYRFVTDNEGRIKFAIEYLISAEYFGYSAQGDEPPDITPCEASVSVVRFLGKGFEYIPEMSSKSTIQCARYLETSSPSQKTSDQLFDDAFNSTLKRLFTYHPLPNIAKHINFERNDDADKHLIAQLRDGGKAGRLQLLNAIYAAYPFPKEENPKTPAKNLIAQFDAAVGVVNAFEKAFSGVDTLMRASKFGLFDTARTYNLVSIDLKSSMPPEPLPENSFKPITLFIKNEFPQRPGSPYRFSYEAYRIPDRKPFVVVANHPAFSSQGLITFYGKELNVGDVQFQSSLSGFSVEAPVVEIASPEQIDGINDYSKNLRTYKQSIEKLKRLGAHLSEDYYSNLQSVTEAILQAN